MTALKLKEQELTNNKHILRIIKIAKQKGKQELSKEIDIDWIIACLLHYRKLISVETQSEYDEIAEHINKLQEIKKENII